MGGPTSGEEVRDVAGDGRQNYGVGLRIFDRDLAPEDLERLRDLLRRFQVDVATLVYGQGVARGGAVTR